MSEPHVPDQVVAEVAQTIGELHRAAGLCFAAEVGGLVLERFFHGDMDRFRSHGKKSVSLRKLAAHPAMPLSSCRHSVWLRLREALSASDGRSRQQLASVASANAGHGNPPITATSAKVSPATARCSTCSFPFGAIL